jgi:antitoxin ParD1/3/4
MDELDRMREAGAAQAKNLRLQAREGGLRFMAYLPPDLADWVLDLVERKIFDSPSHAVFVFLQEQRELEPHGDLREELMRRRIIAAMNDPRPGREANEVFAELRERLAAKVAPVLWQKGAPRGQQ